MKQQLGRKRSSAGGFGAVRRGPAALNLAELVSDSVESGVLYIVYSAIVRQSEHRFGIMYAGIPGILLQGHEVNDVRMRLMMFQLSGFYCI